jgi:RNA polymerase sigma-70 factor (ECF subfamily)
MKLNTSQHPIFSVPQGNGYDFATWFIKQKTNELVGHFGITEDDREDIEQDLALDLIERWPQFDAKRSKPCTFITLVVEHEVSEIIRHRMTEQRRFEQINGSLTHSIEEEVTTNFRTHQPHRLDQEYFELTEDVASVLERLPPELRELCERLKTDSIAVVADQMGIPLTTLRYRLANLHGIFKEKELQEYL